MNNGPMRRAVGAGMADGGNKNGSKWVKFDGGAPIGLGSASNPGRGAGVPTMKLLFVPAIRLLDRLSYPLKFGLIILVCAAASAILLTQIFVNLRGEIRLTQQEIAGIDLFDAGFAVIL